LQLKEVVLRSARAAKPQPEPLAKTILPVHPDSLQWIARESVHWTPAQGPKLYNPATETTLKGSVVELRDFACPVCEGEIGSHLMLKTGDKLVQEHLVAGRIVRSNKLSFNVGDQLRSWGSKVELLGEEDIIAREITRGNENYVFRDRAGDSMLVQ
jgi:hypothetical protein